MKYFILLLFITSCAIPERKQVIVDVEAREAGPTTKYDRILQCVDKYRAEGFKKSYDVCKDLYNQE